MHRSFPPNLHALGCCSFLLLRNLKLHHSVISRFPHCRILSRLRVDGFEQLSLCGLARRIGRRLRRHHWLLRILTQTRRTKHSTRGRCSRQTAQTIRQLTQIHNVLGRIRRLRCFDRNRHRFCRSFDIQCCLARHQQGGTRTTDGSRCQPGQQISNGVQTRDVRQAVHPKHFQS